jgi:hypothetical protein
MSKRTTMAVFVALLTLGGTESTPAPAASLFVGGIKLSTGSKAIVASKAAVDESVLFNAPSLSLRIGCSGSNAIASTLIGENKGEAEARVFEGCSEIAPTNCKLDEPTITTEAVITTFSVATKAPEARFVLEPKIGHLFAGIGIEGPKCTLQGEKPVNGTVKGKLPTGQSEEASQLVEGLGSTEGNNSLEIGGNKFFIEKGKGLVKLASGSKWSFR